MKWYFALNARSLSSARPYWERLISVAVGSARRHTSLEPHLIYDGDDDPFHSTLRRWGVRIVRHRVSFAEALESHSSDLSYSHIATGAFLRTEIPLIDQSDEVVLYTDCDVMFLSRLPDFRSPNFFACAPEFDQNDFDRFNTGVMLMNLPSLRDTLPEFRSFIIDNLSSLKTFDQDGYRFFYEGKASHLPLSCNWKPYWGVNSQASIVHFHGPKPDWSIQRLDDLNISGELESMLSWNREGYRFYINKWKEELSSVKPGGKELGLPDVANLEEINSGARLGFGSVIPWVYYQSTGTTYEIPTFLDAHAPLGGVAGVTNREMLLPPVDYEKPPAAFVRGPDPSFLSDLAAEYARWASDTRRSPPIGRCRIERVMSFETALFAQADGRHSAIYETLRVPDRPYVHFAKACSPPAWDQALPQPHAAYIGSVGSSNYGHWLVDDLTRVMLCTSDTLVMPDFGSRMNAVRRDSVAMVAPQKTCMFAPHSDFLRFDEMEFVTPTSRHPLLKSPPLLERLRDFSVAQSKRRRERRLFIPRAHGTRNLLNSDEVRACVEAAGFETFVVEDMDFAAQVDAFASAEVVVGVMGAAMTSSIFCGRASRVGYLAPTGWKEPFYWDLAAAMQQSYAVTFGATTDSDRPPHLRDFSIDLDDLEELLEWCLG